jgi:hypothetical protein
MVGHPAAMVISPVVKVASDATTAAAHAAKNGRPLLLPCHSLAPQQPKLKPLP